MTLTKTSGRIIGVETQIINVFGNGVWRVRIELVDVGMVSGPEFN